MNRVCNKVIAQHIEHVGSLHAAAALLEFNRQNNGRGSALVLVQSSHDENTDDWEAVAITSSTKQIGFWQVSYFGASGFTGDCQCPSKLVALQRAMREGFTVLNSDVLKRMVLTPKFQMDGEVSNPHRHTHTEV